MKSFLCGIVFCLVVFAVWTYLYFRLGYASVDTAATPLPFERTFAKPGLNARIAKEAPKTAAVPATPKKLVAARDFIVSSAPSVTA